MTAMNEYAHEDRPTSGKIIALTLVRGLVVLLGFTGIVGALEPRPELWTWQRLCIAAASLVISISALWSLSRVAPSRTKANTLIVVLAAVTVMGFERTKIGVDGLIGTDTLWGPWDWQTAVSFAKNLLMLLIGIGGFLWLRPWNAWQRAGEPVSPKIRRANRLFALSGLVAIPGTLALVHATRSTDGGSRLFSNSAVPPGVATFAIASWLLGMAISWWWYFSADEHERHAYDFGTLVGGGLFLTVTPAWWIAARADLLPPPDAMVLWVITMGVTAIGWSWRR